MTEDFDPEALTALISAALVEQNHTSSDTQELLFSFGDTTMLAVLDEVLGKHLPSAEVVVICDALRDRLYASQGASDIRQLHTALANVQTDDLPIVLPSWNVLDPDLAIISHRPPFGGAGDILANCLKVAGFSSRHVVWSYLCRTNFKTEIAPWMSWCYAELRIWRPKLIIGLGGEVSEALLGIPISESQGKLFWVGPWPILMTYGPLYAEKANRMDTLRADMAKGHNFLYGGKRE